MINTSEFFAIFGLIPFNDKRTEKAYNEALSEYSEKFLKPIQKKHDDLIKQSLIDKKHKQDYFEVIP